MINFYKIFLTLLITLVSVQQSYSNSDLFPVKGSIRKRVDFWKKVYTEISSTESFIHDANDQSIIYKKVPLPKGKKARIRFIKKEKRKIRTILYSIAKNQTKNLTSFGQKILGLVADKSTKEIYQMAKNIRFQYGLRDRYYAGLIRSYKFLDFIQQTYKDMGLPIELSYLPHVESSFNYKAYSKVGAAGIWQFMRSTGRLYGLKVNYLIDERRDPIKATRAAARLLRDNYRRLNSWPLALTAYNHGAQSMLRAIKKLGTTDINTIVKKYKGRRFGFASKNFYATFMATVEISKNPEKYFKAFKKPKQFKYTTIKLNRAYTISQIKKAIGLSNKILQDYNFQIRPKAYRSPLYLPKGFKLKLPELPLSKIAIYQSKIDKMKSTKGNQYAEYMHIISRGETLFDISQIYKVDMYKIITFNDISNPSRIFPGMKLKIPGKKTKIKRNTITKTSTKLEPVKVATFKQANRKDKEVFNFTEDLFSETFGKVLKKDTKAKSKILAPPLIGTPEINLASYDLDIIKINKNLYNITIETEETLGHFADWGLIRIRNIRKHNRLSFKSNISTGSNIQLPILSKNIQRFKKERNEYHLSIQEDFYGNFKYKGTKAHKVRRGESIHSIIQKYDIPYWVLRKHQPKAKLPRMLKIGDIIEIPKFEEIEEDSSLLPKDDDQENED